MKGRAELEVAITGVKLSDGQQVTLVTRRATRAGWDDQVRFSGMEMGKGEAFALGSDYAHVMFRRMVAVSPWLPLLVTLNKLPLGTFPPC